jgi:hypothetical protein
MFDSELLALLVSVVALIISAASFHRTSRLQAEQKRQAKVTADLAEEQLRARTQALVVVELERGENGDHLCITNTSDVAFARNVDVEFVDCPRSPLIDADRVLPLPVLAPGQRVRLYVSITFAAPPRYTTRVSWQNPDGTDTSRDYYLTVVG